MAVNDLLTLDEAKRALNIVLTNTDFDIELGAYISAVSEQLDALCGPVVKRTVTDEMHHGGGVIWPRQPPAASVTSVTEYRSGTATVLTGETATVAGDYLLENAATHGSVLRRRSGWSDSAFPAGRSTVAVTYVAGRYEATVSVAAKFKQAGAICLANLWRREQGAGSVTFGAETPEGRIIPTFGLPNAARDLLFGEFLAPAVA